MRVLPRQKFLLLYNLRVLLAPRISIPGPFVLHYFMLKAVLDVFIDGDGLFLTCILGTIVITA